MKSVFNYEKNIMVTKNKLLYKNILIYRCKSNYRNSSDLDGKMCSMWKKKR